jgi:hypothetical protein
LSRITTAITFLVLSPAVTQADERPGNLWDTTSQMSMPGLPAMAPQKMKLCTAKVWTQPPPPPPGQSCTTSNFQRDGEKVSWDTQCTGEMDMTGHGEITFTGDEAYSGVINFTAEGMTVTINLSGTKIGECNNPIS